MSGACALVIISRGGGATPKPRFGETKTDTASRRILAPAFVAVVTFLAFLPVLRNGFVDWDDTHFLLNNPFYRGLGWTQLGWMFGAGAVARCDQYIPLTWVSWGLDYLWWGTAPIGYHLTSLLLHAANAALFFFVSRRLFQLAAAGDGSDEGGLDLAAAFAALLFSLHPLRVESVAWATERKDVLSGLFYLLTFLAYLKSCACPDKRAARAWLGASVAFFALGLLSKVSGLAVPLVLVLLDIYPLRRLPADARRWLSPEARAVWFEKVPFVLASAAAGGAGLISYRRLIHPLAVVGVGERLALSVFSSAFYLWKPLAPVGLVAIYERPQHIDVFAWPFVLSGLVVAGVSAAACLWRRRAAAGLAVWAAYLALLAPVMGLLANGEQIAADRYTYLPCLGFPLVVAGLLRSAKRRTPAWLGACAALLVVLASLTWRQTQVWRDSESLWRHVLSVRPDSAVAQDNMGNDLRSRGRLAEAEAHYREAVRLRPSYPDAHNNLAAVLGQLGQDAEAVAQLQEALRLKPDYAEAHYNLGLRFHQRGQIAEAMAEYREALRFKPSDAEAHNNLGVALLGLDRAAEAVAECREALRADPNFAFAHHNLGLALQKLGATSEAMEHFEQALRFKPGYLEAHFALGTCLDALGRPAEAIAQYQAALLLNPGFAPARERAARDQQALSARR